MHVNMLLHKCSRVTLWGKGKRFGTKAACPPLPFILDTEGDFAHALKKQSKSFDQLPSRKDLANVSAWFSLLCSARQGGTSN